LDENWWSYAGWYNVLLLPQVLPLSVTPIGPPILGQISHPFAQSRSTIREQIPHYRWICTGTGCGSMGGGVSTTPVCGPSLVVLSMSQYLANDNAECVCIQLVYFVPKGVKFDQELADL